jgi:glycosyltransferase involved in cell wall biosynthesis
MKIAIILPAYNEERAIAQTLEEYAKVAPQAEFYVIDNASLDRTAEISRAKIQELGLRGRVLSEPRKGKGNAMRRAFREIEADVYVMVDADATYVADDLPALLAPVLEGRADICVGDRHANSVYRAQNTRRFHDFGNRLVRGMINALFKSNLQDIMSGYRVCSRFFVKNLPLLGEGFEIETEMTLHAVDKRFALLEIPAGYRARPEGSFSKLSTFKDGFRIVRTIFWIFKDYRPLIFFSGLSAVFGVFGLAFGIPVILEFQATGLVPKFPSAILATGLMTLSALFLTVGFVLDTVAKIHREQFELRLLEYKK